MTAVAVASAVAAAAAAAAVVACAAVADSAELGAGLAESAEGICSEDSELPAVVPAELILRSLLPRFKHPPTRFRHLSTPFRRPFRLPLQPRRPFRLPLQPRLW